MDWSCSTVDVYLFIFHQFILSKKNSKNILLLGNWILFEKADYIDFLVFVI